MAIIDEVRQMQLQGTGDEQIVTALRERGMKYKEIVDAISQSKIIGAVEQPSPEPALYENPMQESQMQQAPEVVHQQQQFQQPPQYQQQSYSQQSYPQAQAQPQFSAQDEVMQPSIMNAEYQNAAYQDPSQQYSQDQQQYQEQYQQAQQQYDQSQSGQQYAQPDQYGNYQQYAGYISPDTITEISEQVVAEKLSEIRKHLEKVIDFRTTVDSKISFIDERLKRIEKIIDTLQASVLRKVGDYVTDISDIKNELIQTQKTFAKILESKQAGKQKPHIQKQENHHEGHQQHSSRHPDNSSHPQNNHNPHNHEHKR